MSQGSSTDSSCKEEDKIALLNGNDSPQKLKNGGCAVDNNAATGGEYPDMQRSLDDDVERQAAASSADRESLVEQIQKEVSFFSTFQK